MPLRSPRQGNAFGVLDVGTSKTVCFIVSGAELRTGGRRRREGVRVLGCGSKPSRGVKAGVVIDHDGAEQAVRAAVTQAEQAAGMTIDQVYLAVNCGGLQSRTFTADTRVDGGQVKIRHLNSLRAAGRRYVERDGSKLLHMNVLRYRLDTTTSMSEPLGMAGQKLAADLHVVTVDDAPLRSLANVVERAGYDVLGFAAAPHASGVACTTAEDRRSGVICVDLGAGTTTLSMFSGGHLLFLDAHATGGQHLTFDISRGLSTPFDQAERIKTLYGTLDIAASEEQGMVAYTLAGEEEPTLYQTSKSRIRGIVTARVADLLNRVAERIERSGTSRLAAQKVVLTGGGSGLPGLVAFAERTLGRPVQVAQAQPVAGLQAPWCQPQFATAIGLTQIALEPGAGTRRTQSSVRPEAPSYITRVGQWLRKGF